ncbi:MAG: tyrosine-type recombinase/integrase [Acidobacteriota bacterium]
MSRLRQILADYLTVRRALGYKLERAAKLLAQYFAYVESRHEEHLRLETMLAWATRPTDASRYWAAYRLSIVRRFAIHVQAIDPTTEVPSADVLSGRHSWATPYLYADHELWALLAAAGTLRTPHRIATYRTLLGLLMVTGMRVGEALALDRGDIDATDHVLTIRLTTFGKSREVPVDPSTVDALQAYIGRRDRPHGSARTPAVLVSTAGTRLRYTNVQGTFHRLVRCAGLTARSAACRPRLHDLRHRSAVRTLLDAYEQGKDPDVQLARLSTYLGHVDPKATYWYLSAAPELLHVAGDRLAHSLGAKA